MEENGRRVSQVCGYTMLEVEVTLKRTQDSSRLFSLEYEVVHRLSGNQFLLRRMKRLR